MNNNDTGFQRCLAAVRARATQRPRALSDALIGRGDLAQTTPSRDSPPAGGGALTVGRRLIGHFDLIVFNTRLHLIKCHCVVELHLTF